MATMERIRDDTAIRNDVLAELEWNPMIAKPTQISVAVNNGVVTLTGTVNSYVEKMAAERAAKRVWGVRALADDLQVKLPSESVRSDSDIAAAALRALQWDTWVPADRIQVTVHEGWVTLEGNVDWYYQKRAAERDVRNLLGVRGVTNLITVALHRTSPTEIKARIEQALKRSAELDASRIRVESTDSKVILQGTVRSWAERQQAEEAAWSTPGVATVEDHIEVMPYA